MSRRLIQLLAKNRNRGTRPRIEVNEETAEATVYIYDVIDPYGWGVSAKDFVGELNQIAASTIHLRINSPGGDVFDARAILTALQQHKAKKIVHIDGLAASAASLIMLAGDEIEIAQGGFVMIHKAWAFAMGNADDMTAMASMLAKVDHQLVGDYERKSGQSADQIAAWMSAETWMDADEAVANKFVDRIYTPEAAPENRFDLTAYDKAPAALIAPPKAEPDTLAIRALHERRLRLYELTEPA